MAEYVLKRVDGAYVATLDQAHSYVRDLRLARIFGSLDLAEGERCGNEIAVPLRSELPPSVP